MRILLPVNSTTVLRVRIAGLLAVLAGGPLTQVASAAALPELIVEAPAELQAEAKVVLEVDRRRLEAAARLIGLRGAQPPVRVVLAAEGSPPAAAVPAWISGYAYGSLGRVVLLPERTPSYPDGSLEELLLHELTHVLVARAAGERPVPRWFNEGLAMMAGGPWNLEDRTRLTFALVRRTERPLGEVENLFNGSPAEVRRAYALSGALVRDIVLRYGRPTPRRILAGIARGKSFAGSFRGSTGVTLNAAMRSFWQRHSFWYRWVPLLGSSFTLWVMIVLLAFVAWWPKRRRVAALQRAWEEEERFLEPPPQIH
jgi:hypothetical protein